MTDWVMVETDVLRAARKRLSLSYEAVARRLHVSSKTYERYEKQGRVPRGLFGQLVELLEIEVEVEPPSPRARHVVTDETHFSNVADEILARLEAIEELLRR